ncbi:hypothetical protein GOP47_0031159 [Adiantum capillus-veneris]|nr:hypothetical protein GOP47_0031159 [Adiantum capillus-veneris]
MVKGLKFILFDIKFYLGCPIFGQPLLLRVEAHGGLTMQASNLWMEATMIAAERTNASNLPSNQSIADDCDLTWINSKLGMEGHATCKAWGNLSMFDKS